MTPAVRFLVPAAALMALALTTATSLAGQSARERIELAGDDDETPGSQLPREGARTAETPRAPRSAARGADARRDVSPLRAPSPAAPPTAAKARRRPGPQATASRVRIVSGRTVAVRRRPGGRVLARLDSRTEFGSPQVLSAVKARGRWLGVASTARPDGTLGWVDSRSRALRAAPAKISVRADLSRPRVELRRGEKVTERIAVAIGRSGSSTPTGRFTVTDKLNGRSLSPYYGCCVLALSGTQPNLPPGWSGGNRLAIHGTDDPDSIGDASPAGCLRAADSDLRRLMRRVPLGTPVEVRR